MVSQPPVIRVLARFKQQSIRDIIDYMAELIDEDVPNTANLVWIYALLAIIDKPLLGDTSASLESIRIRCHMLRVDHVSFIFVSITCFMRGHN